MIPLARSRPSPRRAAGASESHLRPKRAPRSEELDAGRNPRHRGEARGPTGAAHRFVARPAPLRGLCDHAALRAGEFRSLARGRRASPRWAGRWRWDSLGASSWGSNSASSADGHWPCMLGLAPCRAAPSRMQLLGGLVIAGIGFTVALFIAALASATPPTSWFRRRSASFSSVRLPQASRATCCCDLRRHRCKRPAIERFPGSSR